MYKIDTQFKELIIIGNGFDLNLGLKTSYRDFIESDKFSSIPPTSNLFPSFLRGASSDSNWIDIENVLKQVSQSYTNPEEDFYQLCENLKEYISSLPYDMLNRDSHAYKFISSLMGREFLILDFNYTNTTKLLLSEIGFPDDMIAKTLIKVHGSIEEGNIIFGVEDDADINPSHVYFKKSYSRTFKGINLFNEASKIETVKIFGHSLGDTDFMYFHKFFQAISNEAYDGLSKNIHLYHYGRESYKNLHIQLQKLTGNNLFTLKQNNQFYSIDTSL
jgi:hypothetical protein